jgi:DNA mismatch endonuclease (patch repair protein)
MGFRFRLHRKDLPSKPDLVFPGKKKVIFVHGCFWHGHGCRLSSTPKTNQEFWMEKIRKNKERDVIAELTLKSCGWDVMVVWECETRKIDMLPLRLRQFLGEKA